MRIHEEKNIINSRVKIHVFLQNGDERSILGRSHVDSSYIQYVQKVGTMLSEDDILPFIDLPEDMWNDFVKCVLEYAADNDIKPADQYRMEGEMKQKDEHIKTLKKAYDVLMHNVKLKK